MKRSFIILSFLQWSNALAQDTLNLEKYYHKPKVTSVEFMVGPSLVAVTGDNRAVQSTGGGTYLANSLKSKNGYSFGIGLIHKLNKHFEVSARLFWERKGYVENLDSLSLNSSGTSIESITPVLSEDVKNDYLTLSIVPQFTFGKRLHFNVGAGGYVSSLISSYTQITQAKYPTFSFVSDPNYNKYDFGFSFNAGFSYPIKARFELTTQLVANFGLSHISDRFVSFNYPKWYNNSYSMLIGIRIFNKNHKS